MADYTCTIRTNYFQVKNEEQFKSFMEQVYGREDGVHVFVKTSSKTGEKQFGFYCESTISGICDGNPEQEECDHNAFIKGLQACLAPEDAILIMESGHEKLNYVVGACWVITPETATYLDLTKLGICKAREQLGNFEWTTECDY